MDELHQKYAPVLRYAKGEQFFPMQVEDMLRYSSLHLKSEPKPLIQRGQLTPNHLAQYSQSPQVFLRSVETGPTLGTEVVKQWSAHTLEMVHHWAKETSKTVLFEEILNLFSPKNRQRTPSFWWNRLARPLVEGTLETGIPDELPSFSLPAETRHEAAEQFTQQFQQNRRYTYYYRQIQDGAYLCLQYWFFYSFNDWANSFGGFNDHEGDWENLMLFFPVDGFGQAQEPPAYITYVGHHARLTKPWNEPEVEKVGNHPVAYIAAGSHASYPQAQAYSLMSTFALTDYATGDGQTIDHDDWVNRLPLDQATWLTTYRGSWGTRFWLPLKQSHNILKMALSATPLGFLIGQVKTPEIELPGVSAPHGPMIGDDGQERPQWRRSVRWADIATLQRKQ